MTLDDFYLGLALIIIALFFSGLITLFRNPDER